MAEAEHVPHFVCGRRLEVVALETGEEDELEEERRSGEEEHSQRQATDGPSRDHCKDCACALAEAHAGPHLGPEDVE